MISTFTFLNKIPDFTLKNINNFFHNLPDTKLSPITVV